MRRKKRIPSLLASDRLRVLRRNEIRATAPVRWIAASATDGASAAALPNFEIRGYNGGQMDIAGWPWPVIVDQSGFQLPARSRPVLRDHDRSQIVGHTTSVRLEGVVTKVSGIVSGTGAAAREVVDNGKNEYPWQASMGWEPTAVEFVKAGATAQANGRSFSGPCYIVRASRMKEISFVALGADDETSARIAASAARANRSENDMRKKKKHKASTAGKTNKSQANPGKRGRSAEIEAEDELEPTGGAATATIEAEEHEGVDEFGQPIEAEAEHDDVEASDDHEGEDDVADDVQASDDDEADEDDGVAVSPQVKARRAEAAAEERRIAMIKRKCGRNPDLCAKAIEQGWSADKAELHLLRASRPSAPAVGRGSDPMNRQTLIAAACLTAGHEEKKLLADFGERTLNAASRFRHIRLSELMAHACRIEGKHVPNVLGDGRALLEASYGTVTLPYLLGQVVERTLLQGYADVPITSHQICKLGSVKDFRAVKRVRLDGTGAWPKVGDGGELQQGKFSETVLSVQADTYGQMVTLTRRDLINDDLGGWLDLPRMMGAQAGWVQDYEFYSLLLANTGNFFHANNGNYIEGASTVFGVDGLSQLKAKFRKQKAGPGSKAADKRSINIQPKFLLVPVEVETDAEVLLGSAQVVSGNTGKVPVDNPHRGKYELVSAPQLSDDTFTNYSATGFYLFADPNVLAAFELVHLMGKRVPTIERATLAGTLGFAWQAYIDFGVNQMDPKGAAKSKGAA